MKKLIGVLVGKVKTGFQKLSQSKLLTKAVEILTSMTGNVNYPTPNVDMATLGDLVSAYQEALAAAATRDKVAVATKNEARRNLIAALNELSSYVNFTGAGSIPILATSGYDLYKVPEPVTVQKPTKFLATVGPNPGELTTSTRGSKGGRSFVHRYTTDPEMAADSWVSVTTTSKTYTFTGIAKGTEVWCLIAAVGSKGQIMYSDVLNRIVF